MPPSPSPSHEGRGIRSNDHGPLGICWIEWLHVPSSRSRGREIMDSRPVVAGQGTCNVPLRAMGGAMGEVSVASAQPWLL